MPNGDIEILYNTVFDVGRVFNMDYVYTQHEWGDATHINGSSPSAHSIKCRNDDDTKTEDCVMQTSYIAPTCFSSGYTVYTCQTCDYSYKVKMGKRLSHWYGEWLPAENGTHSAKCLRGCEYIDAQNCSLFTVVVNAGEPDETTASICPVCGETDAGFSLSMVSGARTESAAGKLPRGELIVRRASLGDNAALLSVAWEFAGRLEKPSGAVRVLLPAGDFEGAIITLINGSEAGSEIPPEYIEIGGEKYISFDADFTASGEAEQALFYQIKAGN